MVVATRNRAYTLRKVLPSFFEQDGVDEIVLVSDAGTDDTEGAFADIALRYPHVRPVFLRNDPHRGQPGSRNRGAAAATNEFVLFCDDDEYLEPGYAMTCLRVLQERGAGIVSGRRVYMRPNETPEQAVARFGSGVRPSRPFNRHLCELVNGARFTGELSLPLASPVMLTHTGLVRDGGFDEYYGQGNGYREESDFQMRTFLSGREVVLSDATHSIHLPLSEVTTGGQRTGRRVKLAAMVRYTNYFYDKYYDGYAAAVGLRMPKVAAKALFAGYAGYLVTLHPTLYRVATAVVYARKRAVAQR